jgi:hypothetical protein
VRIILLRLRFLRVVMLNFIYLASYTTPGESSSVSMVGGVPVDNPPGYD